MLPLSQRLPDFPWDSLAQASALARAHPDGLVDLSVGSPVDPTPEAAKAALERAADAPGYPSPAGTEALRAACAAYLERRWGAPSATAVLPCIGTKEAIALLPTLLGLGPGDLVVIPELAYPTYEVGAALVGARMERCDDPARLHGEPSLIWLNSPANPHGAVIDGARLRDWIDCARRHRAVLASDECYGEFGWTGPEPVSVLDRSVNKGRLDGLVAVHSASKWANLAGYRAGFVAGDPAIVAELLALRKHLGLLVPGPVQAALRAVLDDSEAIVAAQRQRYRARREILIPALERVGFTVEASCAGLYLWAGRGEDGRASLDWLARRGILVAPGDFYGPAGAGYVRLALTASDERVRAAGRRLSAA